jgi:hypothetical protein
MPVHVVGWKVQPLEGTHSRSERPAHEYALPRHSWTSGAQLHPGCESQASPSSAVQGRGSPVHDQRTSVHPQLLPQDMPTVSQALAVPTHPAAASGRGTLASIRGAASGTDGARASSHALKPRTRTMIGTRIAHRILVERPVQRRIVAHEFASITAGVHRLASAHDAPGGVAKDGTRVPASPPPPIRSDGHHLCRRRGYRRRVVSGTHDNISLSFPTVGKRA